MLPLVATWKADPGSDSDSIAISLFQIILFFPIFCWLKHMCYITYVNNSNVKCIHQRNKLVLIFVFSIGRQIFNWSIRLLWARLNDYSSSCIYLFSASNEHWELSAILLSHNLSFTLLKNDCCLNMIPGSLLFT